MPVSYLFPEFQVIRNPNRCIACRVCERQCANEVHRFDAEGNPVRLDSEESLPEQSPVQEANLKVAS